MIICQQDGAIENKRWLMNLMQSFFDALFREINTPSNQVGPLHAAYDRATAAIGHAVLGAAFVAVAGLWWRADLIALQILIVVAYWLIKERGDLRRRGALADGLEDTAMVGMGTFYAGPWLWPVSVLFVGLFIMWRGYRNAR